MYAVIRREGTLPERIVATWQDKAAAEFWTVYYNRMLMQEELRTGISENINYYVSYVAQ